MLTLKLLTARPPPPSEYETFVMGVFLILHAPHTPHHCLCSRPQSNIPVLSDSY